MENLNINTTNTESEYNPKFIEFRRIINQSRNYKLRHEAVKDFDNYDCEESRKLLLKVARHDECPNVSLEAWTVCKKLHFTNKIKAYVPPKKIYEIKEYRRIQKFIEKTCKKLNITSVKKFEDNEVFEQFINEYKAKYPFEFDIIESKFPYEESQKIKKFIKGEYFNLFGKTHNFDKNYNPPQYIAFKEVMKDYDLQKCLVALNNFKNLYDCAKSRKFVLDLTDNHPYNKVRRMAFKLYYTFPNKERKPRKQDAPELRNHEWYKNKNIHKHMQEIIEELEIENVEQFLNGRKEDYEKLYLERYPNEIHLIWGKLAQRNDSDTRRSVKNFWNTEYYILYPDKKPIN